MSEGGKVMTAGGIKIDILVSGVRTQRMDLPFCRLPVVRDKLPPDEFSCTNQVLLPEGDELHHEPLPPGAEKEAPELDRLPPGKAEKPKTSPP